MADIRLVEIKEKIFADNDRLAAEIRDGLKQKGVFMLNLMASPGGGKTSLIVQTLRGLRMTSGRPSSRATSTRWWTRRRFPGKACPQSR